MDQSRMKPFGGLLFRSGTDKQSSTSVPRTGTDLSTLDISEDKKGALGLTTIYNPPPPFGAVADVVLIHGLGGGSRKTWSHSPDPEHFWPQAWLPADPDFVDVRIHSFGYRADWGERRQSTLNIHDFAQSLIGELKNNPSIRRDHTRIILVGHSMGGCVAKKAYSLARQDQTCKDLAERVHSIFFLGTPHRGSDMAVILESMLMAAWGKKPFVADLTPNSTTLAMINDAFRHFAPDLHLWSFYETLPVKVGMMNRIVVDRHSATLGYHNEEIAAMNADHRHVCKFDSQADPNYRMLRNALHTAVDMTRAAAVELVQPHASIDPMTSDSALIEANSRLRCFLGVGNTLENDLATLQGLKEPGSCQWLTEKTCFTSWKAGKAPGILWLTGRPAAGKSVLSSHVIDHLRTPHAYCSYFLYGQSVTGKSTLSDCFRSLAFQMAMRDSLVRDKVLQLEDEGIVLDNNDDANVWRKLFVGSIFKLPSISQHFWVIDGVDECANFNALFTKRLLATLPEELRLFATSRNLEAIERGLVSLGPRASCQTLSDSDTLDDMRLFLNTKLRELDRLESDEDCEAMCEKILQKSCGSFLWARLVLQEFENAWTEEAMDAVLNEVPAGLQDLYFRMVQSIEVDNRKTILAKAILAWVVLAPRPLTLDELRCAVKLDLNQTLQNMDKAIPNLCGQLVFIDQSNKVHMIHETAREFLVSEDLVSELAVHKKEDHAHLASLLLRYLSGDVLKQQQGKRQHSARHRGFAKPTTVAALDDSLLSYASSFFSEHVYRSSSEDDHLMDELCDFLKSNNILSWIEHIAKTNDLNDITRTAMDLRRFLSRRVKYVPPTDPSVHLVDGWVTDLIRVAAKFRSQLLACPSSIHTLIPPLCPSDSMISRSFTRDARLSGLIVKGLPVGTWDDCLIRMDFRKGQTTAVSHGERFFAVGLSTGQVALYDSGSVQNILNVTHPGRVKILEFSRDDQYLASCGTKHIIVWEPRSGVKMHSFDLQSPPLGVAFFGANELLCAFQSSKITKWSLNTGQHDSRSWKSGDYSYSHVAVPDQPPVSAAFMAGTDDVLLAVGYRNHPVIIWNVLELEPLGQCAAVDNNGIDDMTFNPNPEIVALVVSYNDGRLCVFDYMTMEPAFALSSIFAQRMACSPDGRSLVTGSSRGVIEVFEFDQGYDGRTILTPIYRINALEDSIRGVTFSSDGLRFADVRGQQCRVWAPAALVRKNNELESTSDAVTLTAMAAGVLGGPDNPEITSALVASVDGRCVVAGKRGGNVALFSTVDGREVGVLYQHARAVSVVVVALGEPANLVVSADDSGRVLAAELAMPLPNAAATAQLPGQKLSPSRMVLDRRFGGVVVRLLINAAADRLLVSGRNIDELWELPSGKVLASTEPPVPAAPSTAVSALDSTSTSGAAATAVSSRSAFQHPANSAWFVVVAGDVVRIYNWADFSELTPADGIRLERPTVIPTEHLRSTADSPKVASALPPLLNMSQSSAAMAAMATYHVAPGFVVEHLQACPSAHPRLHVWPAASLDPGAPVGPALPAAEPNLDAIAPAVLAVLGVVGTSTLVFLDVNLWVCSTELQSTGARSGSGSGLPPTPTIHARRHFFALSEWRAVGGELRCTLAAVPSAPLRGRSRDVAFADGHRVVVVKGGLEFSETVVAARMAPGSGHSHRGGGSSGGVGGNNGQHVWEPVSGSMHRRASNW
ncbi:hypothetical protein QBC33DRAFT_564472 [Phialemonium atrogriseum]|uniref:GPI inositol-deacylase n=1 Tax=Phialemonium atrogriseum TaxID=1093897 RepID=A0AAJ0FH37_9PEZI|nr:uncharacterized protein QBC33DRAFT_564472 [Phialemonium atrogriseum]KAK1761729.1 hypothetical protein QBC33DRAFT_564472 [Phialemonium atrogriseum]